MIDGRREDLQFGFDWLDFGHVENTVGVGVSQVGRRRWHIKERRDSVRRLDWRIGMLVVLIVVVLVVAVVVVAVVVVAVVIGIVVVVILDFK